MVAPEAMAVGSPVVARQGDIPELVEDRVTGRLAEAEDAACLASIVDELITNEEIWPLLTQAARKHIEERYDIEKLNDQLVALYERLSASRKTQLCQEK